MMTARKILFPTDFTSRAERAFAHAAYLAEAFDAELHVLNVVVRAKTSPDDPMGHLGLEKESDDTWSDAFRLKAGGGPKVVHAQVRIVSPIVGILHYADSHDIDMIVMATHGRKALDHFLVGSVAEEVVRLATCPVFTIAERELTGDVHAVGAVLVPVDFSASSTMTVAYAKEMAAIHGARLDLLHVIEEAVFPTIYGVDPIAIAVPHVIERSRQSLDELSERAAGPDVPVECHIRLGHPVNEIVNFAEETASGLIVIATHGLTGLQRLLMGSVSEKVVRTAPCPVLTVKTYGKILVSDGPETPQLSTAVAAAPETSA